jgi:hypothetical protein
MANYDKFELFDFEFKKYLQSWQLAELYLEASLYVI